MPLIDALLELEGVGDLSSNEVSDEGFARLACHLPRLAWLSLDDDPLGAKPDAWVKLLMDGALPALRRLSWQYEHTGEDPDDGVLALIEKSRLKKLMTTSAGAM